MPSIGIKLIVILQIDHVPPLFILLHILYSMTGAPYQFLYRFNTAYSLGFRSDITSWKLNFHMHFLCPTPSPHLLKL